MNIELFHVKANTAFGSDQNHNQKLCQHRYFPLKVMDLYKQIYIAAFSEYSTRTISLVLIKF